MPWKPEDLPICSEVIFGHTLYGENNDKIQSGDLIQIIAPRSAFHKWVCIFDKVDDRTVWVMYNSGWKSSDGESWFNSQYINPLNERLTWEDFKFKKLNSLEDAEY